MCAISPCGIIQRFFVHSSQNSKPHFLQLYLNVCIPNSAIHCVHFADGSPLLSHREVGFGKLKFIVSLLRKLVSQTEMNSAKVVNACSPTEHPSRGFPVYFVVIGLSRVQ